MTDKKKSIQESLFEVQRSVNEQRKRLLEASYQKMLDEGSGKPPVPRPGKGPHGENGKIDPVTGKVREWLNLDPQTGAPLPPKPPSTPEKIKPKPEPEVAAKVKAEPPAGSLNPTPTSQQGALGSTPKAEPTQKDILNVSTPKAPPAVPAAGSSSPRPRDTLDVSKPTTSTPSAPTGRPNILNVSTPKAPTNATPIPPKTNYTPKQKAAIGGMVGIGTGVVGGTIMLGNELAKKQAEKNDSSAPPANAAPAAPPANAAPAAPAAPAAIPKPATGGTGTFDPTPMDRQGGIGSGGAPKATKNDITRGPAKLNPDGNADLNNKPKPAAEPEDKHAKSRAMYQQHQDMERSDDHGATSAYWRAEAQRAKEDGKTAPNDFSDTAVGKFFSGLGGKKKVNEAIKYLSMNPNSVNMFSEAKKAKKDWDKDGKIESDKDEVWGSRFAAAKKAGKMEEEAEKLDEILDTPMKKLGYIAKNAYQVATADPAEMANDPKKANAIANRVIGAKRFQKKLNKEEVEGLDELAPATMKSYQSKAVDSIGHAAQSARSMGSDKDHLKKPLGNEIKKRKKGLDLANERLAKKDMDEETDPDFAAPNPNDKNGPITGKVTYPNDKKNGPITGKVTYPNEETDPGFSEEELAHFASIMEANPVSKVDPEFSKSNSNAGKVPARDLTDETIDEARGRPKKNAEPAAGEESGRDPRQHIQVIAGQAAAGRVIDFKHNNGDVSKISPGMGRAIVNKLGNLKPAERQAAVNKMHDSAEGLKG